MTIEPIPPPRAFAVAVIVAGLLALAVFLAVLEIRAEDACMRGCLDKGRPGGDRASGQCECQ